MVEFQGWTLEYTWRDTVPHAEPSGPIGLPASSVTRVSTVPNVGSSIARSYNGRVTFGTVNTASESVTIGMNPG